MSKTLSDIISRISAELGTIENAGTDVLSSGITLVGISLTEVSDSDVVEYLEGTGSFYTTLNAITTVLTDTDREKVTVSCGDILTNNGVITTGIVNIVAFLSNIGDKSITGRNVGYGTPNNSLSLGSRFILKDSGIQVVYSGPNGTCLEHDYTFAKRRGDADQSNAAVYMHALRTGQVINSRLRESLRKYIGTTEDTAPEIDQILIDALGDMKQINTIDYYAETNFLYGTINIMLSIELANELTFKLLVGV